MFLQNMPAAFFIPAPPPLLSPRFLTFLSLFPIYLREFFLIYGTVK